MIRTGKKFSKPAMSRVINGDTALSEPETPEEKIRLDLLAKEIYTSYHRSTLQKFIENGFVKVDGETITKPNTKFPRGVKLDLVIPDELKNADLAPTVLYEDNDVIVVNKPAGLLSEHSGEYCPERTLADYGYIAHRLDRGTSGVMILAKSEPIQQFLKRQFRTRTVHKTYYAIVKGRPKLDAAHLDLPIARNKKRPTTFRVEAGGRESTTDYRLLKFNGVYSLLELHPISGRTHQLRVHLQFIGHPIVGDTVYGGPAAERIFLHAGKLEITLPNGERRTFEALLPPEFNQLLASTKD